MGARRRFGQGALEEAQQFLPAHDRLTQGRLESDRPQNLDLGGHAHDGR